MVALPESIKAENDPLTERVIGARICAHKQIGPFLESRYHRAKEMGSAKDPFLVVAGVESKPKIDAYDNEHIVGVHEADGVTSKQLLVELKPVTRLLETHEVHVVHHHFCELTNRIKRKIQEARTTGSV